MLDLISRPAFARCGELLPHVDGARLDCVSDALALLLATRGVTDLVSVFGRDWRFDLTGPHDCESPAADDSLTCEGARFAGPALPPADQDALIARRTGWRPVWWPVGQASALDWHRTLRDGYPLAVVADAFHLPWLPYAGHTHMEHGFVLEGLDLSDPEPLAHIVDPYDNVTEWGRATPQCTVLPLSALHAALTHSRWAILEPAARDDDEPPATTIRANAEAILAARPAYQEFAAQYEPLDLAALDHLALQTWLLSRGRTLHQQWLAAVRPAAAEVFTPVVTAWQRASESAYLALRRVRRGRAAPAGPIESLHRAADSESAVAATLLDLESSPSC